MTVGVPTCAASAPADELARLLIDRNLEAVVVLDHEGHAVGIVSQEELVQSYTRGDGHHLTAEQLMREDVPQIPADIPLGAAAQIMRDQRVRVLYLMHHSEGISYPAAMISYRHLLRHLGAAESTDLEDLGIRARREAPLDTFFKRRDEARRRAQPTKEE